MKKKPLIVKSQKQPIIFLKGKRLRLRPLEADDTERCLRWVNDPEVRHFIGISLPITMNQEQLIICPPTPSKEVVHLAIETSNGVHIGNISIDRIHWIDGTAMTGTLIGDKRYQSKGYGTEAKMLLLDYAFNTLGLRKLHSAAYAFNQRSINYSLKCGYKIIGRKKNDKFRNGAYHDVVLLEVFKDEWQVAYDAWYKAVAKPKTKGVKNT